MSVRVVFQVSLACLGTAALVIGAMIFMFGPAFTGDLFASGLSLFAPVPRPVQLGGVDVDSEMRFYAVLWAAFGFVMIRVSQSLPRRIVLAQATLGVFFAGGLGRVISTITLGPPHPLFQVLMWIELIAPLILAPLSLEISET
jgi:hypothetical protein